MFVSAENNLNLALKFWEGKPSGKLLWYLDAGGTALEKCAEMKGYRDDVEFMQKELGCLIWGDYVVPYENMNDALEITRIKDGRCETIYYASPHGVLKERRKDSQIIDYKVKCEKDLRILVKIWEEVDIVPAYYKFDAAAKKSEGKWPVMPGLAECSAVQHFIQHEAGVENFWYLLTDNTSLVEESMDVWQFHMKKRYDILKNMPAIGLYQAENTSTTMISPGYYEKYSLKHISDFASAGKKSGKRTLVHMCGCLKNILPLISKTGVSGIHSLTPPTTGDTDFDYAYSIMPGDFFMLGRFGSTFWLNKSREDIMKCLASVLPPHIFREHAFVLLVTADAAREVSLENLYILRDCINRYEEVNLSA